MDDLISRRAAVSRISDLLVFELEMKRPPTWNEVFNALQDLPSAEQMIIRCAECRFKNIYQFPPKYDEKDYCDKHEKVVSASDFCSAAERKEHE